MGRGIKVCVSHKNEHYEWAWRFVGHMLHEVNTKVVKGKIVYGCSLSKSMETAKRHCSREILKLARRQTWCRNQGALTPYTCLRGNREDK